MGSTRAPSIDGTASRGHLFQSRFHAVLVDSDAYLIEVCRYVELNPVRAGLVRSVEQWPWSSFLANCGQARPPAWLATSALHGYLPGSDMSTQEHRRRAAELYAEIVHSARRVDLWNEHLRAEIYLGDEAFVLRAKAQATRQRLDCPEISRTQRTAADTLARWLVPGRTRGEAFRLAYSAGGLSMGQIAREAVISISTVSRMIAVAERLQDSRPDTATFKT
jgi:putative transposase